jgi:hypothetical protein
MTDKENWLDVEVTVTLNLTHYRHALPKGWDNPQEFSFTRKFKRSSVQGDEVLNLWLKDEMRKASLEMQSHVQSVNLPSKKQESSTSSIPYDDPEHGFNCRNTPVDGIYYNEEW